MTAPVIDSVLADKGQYVAGVDTIKITVKYHDADSHIDTVTITAVDSAGNAATPVNLTLTFSDPVTVAATDGDGRVFSVSSNDGATAVLTAKA